MASIINRTIQAIPQSILDRITPAGKQLDGLREIHHNSAYDHDATFPLTVVYDDIYWYGTINEHVVFKAIIAEIVEPTPEPGTPEPPEPRITVDLQFIAGEYIWATAAMLGDHVTPSPLLISELGLQHSIHGWGSITNNNGVEVVSPALQIPIAITDALYYDRVSMEPLARFIALGRDGEPMPAPTEPPVPTEEPTDPPTEDQWGFPIIEGRENVIINVQYDLLQHGYAQLSETILNGPYLNEYEPESLTLADVEGQIAADHIHFKVTYEGKHGGTTIGRVENHYEHPFDGYQLATTRDTVLNEPDWDPTTFDADDTDGRYISYEGINSHDNNLSGTYEPFNIYEVNGKKWRAERVTGIRHYWDPVAQEYTDKADEFTLYFSVNISYDETDVHVNPDLITYPPANYDEYVTIAPYGSPNVDLWLTKHVSLNAIAMTPADRILSINTEFVAVPTVAGNEWVYSNDIWADVCAALEGSFKTTTSGISDFSCNMWQYFLPGSGSTNFEGATSLTFSIVDVDSPLTYNKTGPYPASRWWPTTKHMLTADGKQWIWATFKMTNLATGLVEDVVVATHIVINFPNESTNGIIDILPNGLNDIVNNTNGVVEIPQLA